MTGPHRARLDQGLASAQLPRLNEAVTGWFSSMNALSLVSAALRKAAEAGNLIGGRTGPAMFAAMNDSSARLDGHAEQMSKGFAALMDARASLEAAREARDAIDRDLPPYSPRTYTSDPDLTPADNEVARSLHDHGEQSAAADREAQREARARQVADDFERSYEHPVAVMKEIYGYEPPPDRPVHVDRGIGGSSRTGSAPGTTTSGHAGTPTLGGTYHPDHGGAGADGDAGAGEESSDPSSTSGTTTPTGTADGTGDSGTSPSGTPTTPAAGGSGLTGGVVGGVAGAGLLGGLVRGGLGGAATIKAPSTAAPLGGTARGSAGTLGRAGTAPTTPVSRSTTTGATPRGAATGGTPGRGAAAGTRAAGTSGTRSTGAPGASGGARGAGTAAGRNARKERRDGTDRDLFDDGQDWLDDDGVEGVLS